MIFNLMKPIPVADVEPDEPTATMYLYGREADKTVSYNGVVLPELPVWDKTAYPYAYIGNDGKYYILAVYSTSRTVTSTKRITVFSDTLRYTVNENGNEWVASQTAGSMVVVWSNTNVYYSSDGSLYLSASDPITTYENADVTINGVGYVGAVLPKLPEWDKTAYPYAVITYSVGYTLFILKEVSYAINTAGNESIKVTTENCIMYGCDKGGSKWYGRKVSSSYPATSLAIWSNFDMLSTTGTLVLQATEPVPVYE